MSLWRCTYDSLEEAVSAYEQRSKVVNTGGNAVGRDFEEFENVGWRRF